ncbi:MAG: BatA domain-containing protein [Lentisphaeria bacterium]|nr:BatA domain-containing protein [Lentisphaeria bacterium]
MSLLQPEILLWGLPLALIPLVIHLLNRLRYRTVQWAAMGFLLHATRLSTRHARLRQFLILLFRILALLFLAAALARRPLGAGMPAGGAGLGSRVGAPSPSEPDAVGADSRQSIGPA